MKTILEFRMPEEKEEFELAMNAQTYRRAMREFDGVMKNRLKYGKDLSPVEKEFIEQWRKNFHHVLNHRGIYL